MPISPKAFLPLVTALLLGGSFGIYAEEIKLPVGQQAPDKQHLVKPVNGLNKQQVEAKFGEPKEWSDAVGEPPISSWEYSDFVVYFEHDTVLHSVLKAH